MQQALHEHDLPLPPQEVTKTRASIDVPILKPENIGEHMAVDEKYINGEFYTLLTNGKTGKIALMAATTKVSMLNQVMPEFEDKLFSVKILTRDLASNYDWFGRENFMNAAAVADKFHVLKHALNPYRISGFTIVRRYLPSAEKLMRPTKSRKRHHQAWFSNILNQSCQTMRPTGNF